MSLIPGKAFTSTFLLCLFVFFGCVRDPSGPWLLGCRDSPNSCFANSKFYIMKRFCFARTLQRKFG